MVIIRYIDILYLSQRGASSLLLSYYLEIILIIVETPTTGLWL